MQGNTGLAPDTAIATFEGPNERYLGHAAIYMGQNGEGLQVIDQWNGQTAHRRLIRFKNHGKASNDGSKFYVISR